MKPFFLKLETQDPDIYAYVNVNYVAYFHPDSRDDRMTAVTMVNGDVVKLSIKAEELDKMIYDLAPGM